MVHLVTMRHQLKKIPVHFHPLRRDVQIQYHFPHVYLLVNTLMILNQNKVKLTVFFNAKVYRLTQCLAKNPEDFVKVLHQMSTESLLSKISSFIPIISEIEKGQVGFTAGDSQLNFYTYYFQVPQCLSFNDFTRSSCGKLSMI